ncbi:MAG TPA: hypothetical protein VGC55_16445 [Dokdonella sp.]
MQTLRICDIGLSIDASLAFHSMLKIVSGRSVASWQTSDADHADVLLVHVNSNPGALSAWTSSGKPAVLVIDDRASWPPAPFVLRYPFRVMQLLSLLDSIAEHLRSRSTRVPSDGAAWAGAVSLRHLMAQTGDRGWHIAHAGDRSFLWVGDGQAHGLPATLRGLREGSVTLGAFSAATERPPAAAQACALRDVAWWVGAHGPAELAPWLRPDAAYRVHRWPDFGRLGAVPHLIELAAEASARAHLPAELANRAGCTPGDAHRFLAAASLAGLLTSFTRAEVLEHPKAATPARGAWTRFVADLRRHLLRVA